MPLNKPRRGLEVALPANMVDSGERCAFALDLGWFCIIAYFNVFSRISEVFHRISV